MLQITPSVKCEGFFNRNFSSGSRRAEHFILLYSALTETWESLKVLHSNWAPVFGPHQQTSALSSYTIPISSPHPHPGRLCFSREFRVLQQFHGSSSVDYSHPAQWLVGANALRLCTQMGAWPCDSFHMLHNYSVFFRFRSSSFHLCFLL